MQSICHLKTKNIRNEHKTAVKHIYIGRTKCSEQVTFVLTVEIANKGGVDIASVKVAETPEHGLVVPGHVALVLAAHVVVVELGIVRLVGATAVRHCTIK